MTRDERSGRVVKDDSNLNPNALHNLHTAKRGPRGVPETVKATTGEQNRPKDPGHPYARTEHISFDFFDQRTSNAPFGYEYFVSLPPTYNSDLEKSWPLILFLHGAGESQRNADESFLSIRHGIPKIVLCYDKLKADPGNLNLSIYIPRAERLLKKNTTTTKQVKQDDKSGEPVLPEVCTLLAENFITVTPSLNITHGYGWNASILSALLDEIIDRFRVDIDRIHVTGFSMGGYGTWALAMHTPGRFASLMPICGGGDTLRVSHIRHVSQWVHHGDLDDVIPVEASQQMVDALRKIDGVDVQFTTYPTLMHDSWTEAYNNPEVYRWMLRTKRLVQGEEKVVPEKNKVALSL